MDYDTIETAGAGATDPAADSPQMGAAALDRKIDEIDYRIRALKGERAALRRKRPPERMADYIFRAHDGSAVGWETLFDDRSELILIHNMGKSCSYCTLWADGFAGVKGHLENRAAFVVTSPDAPEVQREFADSRGWTFRMYAIDTDFLGDMGFLDSDGDPSPGASFLERRQDGSVWRVQRADIGPGDDFCAVWHLFDLLPRGVADWEPRASYPRK